MAENPNRSSHEVRQFPWRPCTLVLLCATFVMALSGCGARKRPNIPWATAVRVKPVLQASSATQSPMPDLDAPELLSQGPPFAALLLPMRPGPARPRSGPSPTPSGADPEKTAAPVIAPQLSPQEAATAQQETTQSLRIAEKNLAATRGKTLNASQADLVSKIKGFLKDAREAAQARDWDQARGAAKKAEVLSSELVASF